MDLDDYIPTRPELEPKHQWYAQLDHDSAMTSLYVGDRQHVIYVGEMNFDQHICQAYYPVPPGRNDTGHRWANFDSIRDCWEFFIQLDLDEYQRRAQVHEVDESLTPIDLDTLTQHFEYFRDAD